LPAAWGCNDGNMQNLPWWVYLLQGSAGAFIALIGVFAAFLLTRRHDLDRDRKAREVDDQRERHERTSKSVSDVLEAALDVRDQDNTRDLCHALIRFSVREAEYRDAADWASNVASQLWEDERQNNYKSIAWEAGNMTSLLRGWSAVRFEPGYFAALGEAARSNAKERVMQRAQGRD
jgi:hypothetical protein